MAEAAKRTDIKEPEEDLLIQTERLIQEALDALGDDDKIDRDELMGAKMALQNLIDANPSLEGRINIELSKIIIARDRNQIGKLVANISVAREISGRRDQLGKEIRATLLSIREGVKNALISRSIENLHASDGDKIRTVFDSFKPVTTATTIAPLSLAPTTSIFGMAGTDDGATVSTSLSGTPAAPVTGPAPSPTSGTPAAANDPLFGGAAEEASADEAEDVTDSEFLSLRILKYIDENGSITIETFIEVLKAESKDIDGATVEKVLNDLVDEGYLAKEGNEWKAAPSDEDSETDDDEETEWEEDDDERKAREKEEQEELMQEFIGEIVWGKRGPVAQAIIKVIREHPTADFEELKAFMENPAVLSAKRAAELQEQLEKDEDELASIAAKIKDLNEDMKAKELKNKEEIREKRSALRERELNLKKDIRSNKARLSGLSNVQEGKDREYDSLESQLIMINFYFSEKSDKPQKFKTILEESQKAIQKEERAEANRSIWGKGFFEKVGSIFRPTLASTLAVIHTKDDELGALSKTHFMALNEVADKDKGIQLWLKKMKTADGKKIEKAEKMEMYVPKIIAHLEIALYEGRSTKINPLSIEYTRSLLSQLRKEVRGYSMDKAKKTEGGTLNKLDAYFDSLNTIHENKNEVSKDVVFGHATKQKVKASLTGGLGTVVSGGATYLETLLGPYLAGAAAGGLLGGYLTVKSFFVKDPEVKYKYRKWAFRSAVLPALMLGATGPLGVTGYAAYTALAALGTAGFFVPNLIKHRKYLGGDKATESAANDADYKKEASKPAQAA